MSAGSSTKCVGFGPGSKSEAQARNEVSTVAGDVPPCQPQSDAATRFRRVTSFPAQSRQRQPLNQTLRRWSEAAGWPADGIRADESSQVRSPTTECQTHLTFSVTPAMFRQAVGAAKAGWCHGYCGGLARAKLAGYFPCFGDRQRLAPIFFGWPGEALRPSGFFSAGATAVCAGLASLQTSE
jgi:hypothetical protein